MKKKRLAALLLVLLLTVALLPPGASAAGDDMLESLKSGNFSFFAGTYSAYDRFAGGYGGGRPLPNLTLANDGCISGRVTSYSQSELNFRPSSITKNPNGSYTCVNYGTLAPNGRPNGKSAEVYILYPVGVSDPYGCGKDVVRLMYVTLDGGVLEIVYQNTTNPTGGTGEGSVAYASTQNVQIDGRTVEFQCYALKDANGNLTNYIKLRDLALQLNGTKAQFSVDYNGKLQTISLLKGMSYQSNGSEMSTPFSGDRPYKDSGSRLMINNDIKELDAIFLTDDNGLGYTYFKLRDLGRALGFNVSWITGTGIVLNTDEPYSDYN